MSFFSRLFQSENTIESRMISEYSRLFKAQGIPQSEAHATAKQLVAECRLEMIKAGEDTMPSNYGDFLLRQEKSNEKISKWILAKRREGVRDEDIRSWWNLHPIERRAMLKADEMLRTAAFISCLKQGLPEKEAASRVKQANAIYGEPAEGDNPDRPLPIELKERVMKFSERHYSKLDVLKRKMEESTSFNALVRNEIAQGQL